MWAEFYNRNIDEAKETGKDLIKVFQEQFNCRFVNTDASNTDASTHLPWAESLVIEFDDAHIAMMFKLGFIPPEE